MALYVGPVALLIACPSLYHWYELPPDTDNKTELAEHKDPEEGEMVPVGEVVTVTSLVLEAFALHPTLLMISTE